MKKKEFLFIAAAVSLMLTFSSAIWAAGAVAPSFTLDGTLYADPTGATTLSDSTAHVRVQILPPVGNDCVLFDEEHLVNTTASNGAFSVQVGNGVRVTPSDSGNTLLLAFQNAVAIDGSNHTCTLNPTAGATRRARIIVTQTGYAPDTLSPDMVISSVPSALVAETLQGISPAGFLKLGFESLTQSNAENIFSNANYSALTSLLAGGGSSSGGSSSGAYAINAGTGGSGGIDFNVNGSTKAAITNAGNFSVDSGTFFVDAANNRIGVGTSAPGASLDLGTRTDAIILPNGTTGQRPSPATAGMMRYNSTSQKFEIYDGLSWANIGSDISGISAGGDLSGTYPSPTVSKIRGQSVSGLATTAGQVLRYDGTDYTPRYVGLSDLKNTAGGNAFSATCSSSQTLTWSSIDDTFVCANIAGLNANVITAGTIDAARLPAFSGDASSVAGSTALTLATVGTAGTFNSVTVDAKGRVTAGTNPTTLSGFGITDAVKNAGGGVSLASGAAAARPSTGFTAGRFYVSTDSKIISYDNGTAWEDIASAAGGTGFTGSLAGDVSGTQGATVVGSVGGSSAVNVNAATGLANAATNLNTYSTIVKRDGSGNFAAGAITASELNLKDGTTNNVKLKSAATSADYALQFPAAAPAAGQSLQSDASGILSWVSAAAGSLTNVLSGNSAITLSGTGATRTVTLADTAVTPATYGSATQVPAFTVDAQGRLTAAANVTISGVVPGGAASGDLSGTYPAPAVAKLQGVGVLAGTPTLNQALKYNGANWAAANLGFGDLFNSTAGSAVGSAVCTSGQTMYYDTLAKELKCQAISAAAITSGILPIANGGTGAATLDGAGIVEKTGAQTISGTKTFTNLITGALQVTGGTPGAGKVLTSDATGNATWGSAGVSSQWTTASPDIYFNTGKVGIGSSAPTVSLDVVGEIKSSNNLSVGSTGVNGVLNLARASDGLYTSRVTNYGTETRFENSAGSGYMTWFTGTFERMRVANSGSVGIGTTTPSALLDVRKSATGAQDVIQMTAQSGATSTALVYGVTDASNVLFETTARIRSMDTGSFGGALTFETKAASGAGGTTTVEQMRINAGGNVGIGTTTPLVSLDLSNRTDGFTVPNGTLAQQPSSRAPGTIRWNTSTPGLELWNGSAWTPLTTGASNSYLSSSGGSLSGGLTIASGGLNNSSTGITNAGTITGVGANLTGAGALTIAAGGTAQNLTLSASTTGAVNLTSPNGMGLSVLSPAASSVNYVTVKGAPTNTSPVIGSAGSDANVDLTFTPKGTGRTLFSSGNVGIGTATPASILDVSAPAIATTKETFATFGPSDVGPSLYLGNGTSVDSRVIPSIVGKSTNTGYAGLELRATALAAQDAGTVPMMSFNASQYASDPVSGALSAITTRPLFNFANNGTGLMTMLANGNVGIGVTPTAPLHVNGITQIDGALAPPSFTTRSTGTRLVLYPLVGGATVDHAFGVDGGTSWQSIPDSTRQFLWYAGTTPILTVKGTGNIGIGTTTPGAGLDVQTTGINSALIVPRDTVANRPTTPVNGMIRYASNTNVLEAYVNGAWVTLGTLGGTQSFAGNVNVGGAFTSTGAASLNGGATIAGGALAMSSQNITGLGTNLTAAAGLNIAATGAASNIALTSGTTGAVNSGSANGTSLSVLSPAASSVNFITVKGSPTGTSPVIASAGSDANVDLTFTPKGTGNTVFSNGNVGIGSAAPSAFLDIANTSALASGSVTGARAYLTAGPSAGSTANTTAMDFLTNFNAWATPAAQASAVCRDLCRIAGRAD